MSHLTTCKQQSDGGDSNSIDSQANAMGSISTCKPNNCSTNVDRNTVTTARSPKSLSFKQTAETQVYDPDEPPNCTSKGTTASSKSSTPSSNTYVTLLSGERRKRSRTYLEEESYKHADAVLLEINELVLGISRNSSAERQMWVNVHTE